MLKRAAAAYAEMRAARRRARGTGIREKHRARDVEIRLAPERFDHRVLAGQSAFDEHGLAVHMRDAATFVVERLDPDLRCKAQGTDPPRRRAPEQISRLGRRPGALMGASASTPLTRELDAREFYSLLRAGRPVESHVPSRDRSMRILAIDCSTEALSVAAGDAVDTTRRHGHAGQSHSRLALAWIDEVLAARSWRLDDLDGIAFGAGPGTFTGIRIACGIAQGLALGAGVA